VRNSSIAPSQQRLTCRCQRAEAPPKSWRWLPRAANGRSEPLLEARHARAGRRCNRNTQSSTTPVRPVGASSALFPTDISLPRKGAPVGPHIVCFEVCSAFTPVTACTLALPPYIVARIPKASTISLPPQLLRLLPAGAFRRVGFSPTGKRRLITAHTLQRRSICSKGDARNTGTRHSRQPSRVAPTQMGSDDLLAQAPH
jgi:hypothetical protein